MCSKTLDNGAPNGSKCLLSFGFALTDSDTHSNIKEDIDIDIDLVEQH